MTPSNHSLLSRLLNKSVPLKGDTKITLTLDALDRIMEEARSEESRFIQTAKPIIPDHVGLYRKKPPRW